MEKIQNIVENNKDVIEFFELGKKLYFVNREIGKFEVYEGVVVGISVEVSEFNDIEGISISVQISSGERKENFNIIIDKSGKGRMRFDCRDTSIVYDYFLSEGLAKDFLLKKNEAYMKKLKDELNKFKNKS